MLTGEARTASAGRGQVRLRRGLMAAQVALSLLLLVGAGLFVRSLRHVFAVDPGLRVDKMLTFSIDPSLQGYRPERARRLFTELQEDLGKIPGVASVSGARYPILADSNDEGTLEVEGYKPKKDEDMDAGYQQTLPDFFSTIQIPLLMGREFTARDTAGSPKVVIVNETFVKRFFPHSSPIGRHTGFLSRDWEIVGVVKDAKGNDMREKPAPWAYTPALQEPQPGAMHFYLQTKSAPLSLAAAARAIVHKVDASLPVFDVKTVEMQINETHVIDRMFAMLSAAFGLLATLLASIGLYGLTAYTVTRRTREIGIRIALGAERGNILWIVMKEVLLLTAIGLLIGIPASLALGRFVQNLLFEMKASDPLVLTVAAGTIVTVSLAAGYLPARRATNIDPVHALHYE
jgi:predicted permease